MRNYKRGINYLSGKMGFKPIFKKSDKPVVVDNSIAVKEITPKSGKLYIMWAESKMYRHSKKMRFSKRLKKLFKKKSGIGSIEVFKCKNEENAYKILRKRQSNNIREAEFVSADRRHIPLDVEFDDVFRIAI